MAITDRRPPERTESWWSRLGWLVLLWAAGIATLGVVAEAIRLVMRAAGLADR